MATIRQDDFIDSVADALQFYFLLSPSTGLRATPCNEAYEQKEQNPAAKGCHGADPDQLAYVRSEGKRPICQDTGIVTVFLKIGNGRAVGCHK